MSHDSKTSCKALGPARRTADIHPLPLKETEAQVGLQVLWIDSHRAQNLNFKATWLPGAPSWRMACWLALEELNSSYIVVQTMRRVRAVSCNRHLAALGRSQSCLWEQVDFPYETNPSTVAAWLAAKRTIMRKADLCRFGAAGAVYLLAVLAGSGIKELSLDLNELTHFNPNVVQLPHLRKLSIAGSSRLGLEVEGSFSHLCHLSSLQLSELSPNSVGALGLPKLQHLSCKISSEASEADLHKTGLGQATSLTSLTLDIDHAESLPGLLLPELPALEQLSISGEATAQLARATNWEGFPQLRSLSLHAYSEAQPLDLQSLTGPFPLEVSCITLGSRCRQLHRL